MDAGTASSAPGTPAEPSGGGLSDLLSSRKLMVVGILLGFLLVTHFLVSLWLLCLVFALFLVLGGWQGPSALMGASGRLHLERFFTMAHCSPDPEAEGQLEQEIHRTIQMIIRDFVSSWYRSVSQEPAFEEEMEAAMRGLAQELRKRMGMVDSPALTELLKGNDTKRKLRTSRMKSKRISNSFGVGEQEEASWYLLLCSDFKFIENKNEISLVLMQTK